MATDSIPGLRFTDPRVQALLSTLCVFRLLPRGFTTATCAPTSRPTSDYPLNT